MKQLNGYWQMDVQLIGSILSKHLETKGYLVLTSFIDLTVLTAVAVALIVAHSKPLAQLWVF